jgi:hypothetical protein
VRQHVDLGENVTQQWLCCRRVRKGSPVSPRYLASTHCLLPKSAHFFRCFRFGELIDPNPMPAIERLVQKFAALLALMGEQHPARM